MTTLDRAETNRLGEAVSKLANELRTRADRLGRTDLSRRINAEAERWAETTSSVAIVGAPGAGKTRLVQALTGRNDLPLAGPTTVPTIVTQATSDSVRVCDVDGRLRDLATDALAVEPARTEYVELRIDAPRLVDGITLIDNVGHGAVHDPRGNRSYLVSRRADHLMVVQDLATPLSGPDGEFVVRCADRFASIALVGTRIDRVRGWRRVLDDSAAALRSALPHCEIVTFGVSPVLADAAFSPDTDDDEAVELLEESGLAGLQSHLVRLANGRRTLRLANFTALLDSIADELAREGRVVIQATVEDTQADVDRISELRGELTRVRDDRSSWFATLGDSIAGAREETSQDLTRTLNGLVTTYDAHIATLKGNDSALLAEFDDDLRTEAAAFAARIAERIERVVALMTEVTDASDLGVRIDPDELAHRLAELGDDVDGATATRTGASGVGLRATGGLVGMVTSSTMMLTALSGVGGAAALMRVGAFGAAALFSGVSTAISVTGTRREQGRQHARATIKAKTDAIRSTSQATLRGYLLAVQRTIESHLKEVARERIAVLERELSELQTTARADAGERRRRAASLEQELHNVGALREQTRELASTLRDGGST